MVTEAMRARARWNVVVTVLAIIVIAAALLMQGWYYADFELSAGPPRVTSRNDYGLYKETISTKVTMNNTTTTTDRTVAYSGLHNSSELAFVKLAKLTRDLLIVGLVLSIAFLGMSIALYTTRYGNSFQRNRPIIIAVGVIAGIIILLTPIHFYDMFFTDVAHDYGTQVVSFTPGRHAFLLSGAAILLFLGVSMSLSRTRLMYIEPLPPPKV